VITEFREVERKYDLPDTCRLPTLDGIPGVSGELPGTAEVLTAVYFDTEDLRLAAAGTTLRRRTGGGDAGWHLKLPAGEDARTELRLPLGDRADEPVPGELETLVSAQARRAPLVPVARLRTERSPRVLVDAAGRRLAEVVSDQVVAHTCLPPEQERAWHETEVELVGGDVGLLDLIGAELRAAGARPAAHGSKLHKALGPRLPRGHENPVDARTPARAVVLAYLREQVAAITAIDPHVRRNEPDAVHQMRVATRRMRSALQAFHTEIPRERARELVGELRWLGVELGRSRDREVLRDHMLTLLGRIPPEAVRGPVHDRLTILLADDPADDRDGPSQELEACLDSDRYHRLLLDADALLNDLATPPGRHEARAGSELFPAAAHSFRRLESAMTAALAIGDPAARDDASPDPALDLALETALHDARKAAKRVRYVAEALTPLAGPAATRFVRQVRQLQDVLGDHQDSVVSRAFLRDAATTAHAAGEESFTYGVLHEREAARARELRRDVPHAWHRLASSRNHYWRHGR
jgi:CHAD domain-containing protein